MTVASFGAIVADSSTLSLNTKSRQSVIWASCPQILSFHLHLYLWVTTEAFSNKRRVGRISNPFQGNLDRKIQYHRGKLTYGNALIKISLKKRPFQLLHILLPQYAFWLSR